MEMLGVVISGGLFNTDNYCEVIMETWIIYAVCYILIAISIVRITYSLVMRFDKYAYETDAKGFASVVGGFWIISMPIIIPAAVCYGASLLVKYLCFGKDK